MLDSFLDQVKLEQHPLPELAKRVLCVGGLNVAVGVPTVTSALPNMT